MAELTKEILMNIYQEAKINGLKKEISYGLGPRACGANKFEKKRAIKAMEKLIIIYCKKKEGELAEYGYGVRQNIKDKGTQE